MNKGVLPCFFLEPGKRENRLRIPRFPQAQQIPDLPDLPCGDLVLSLALLFQVSNSHSSHVSFCTTFPNIKIFPLHRGLHLRFNVQGKKTSDFSLIFPSFLILQRAVQSQFKVFLCFWGRCNFVVAKQLQGDVKTAE